MDPYKPVVGLSVLAVTAAIAGAAVLAGAGVWLWQSRTNAALRTDLGAASASVTELRAKVAGLESELATAMAAIEALTATAPPPAPPAGAPAPGAPAPVTATRQFAYIAKITESAGKYTWSLDYAQFLTGAAAAAAATAHGDESPPPNDYYIVNDNPKLRSFPVAKTAKVTVYFGDPTSKAVLSLGQYHDVWLDNTDNNGKYIPFWVDIRDGQVLGAEEQWTP